MPAERYSIMTQCLILQDNSKKRSRLAGMLSVYGFDLDEAANANEALEKCQRGMPDVVLLPENLPDMDVSTFIRCLRRGQKEPSPVVLLCASDADSERIGKAIWDGASDYLIAPFDAEVLDAKLKQAGVV